MMRRRCGSHFLVEVVVVEGGGRGTRGHGGGVWIPGHKMGIGDGRGGGVGGSRGRRRGRRVWGDFDEETGGNLDDMHTYDTWVAHWRILGGYSGGGQTTGGRIGLEAAAVKMLHQDCKGCQCCELGLVKLGVALLDEDVGSRVKAHRKYRTRDVSELLGRCERRAIETLEKRGRRDILGRALHTHLLFPLATRLVPLLPSQYVTSWSSLGLHQGATVRVPALSHQHP